MRPRVLALPIMLALIACGAEDDPRVTPTAPPKEALRGPCAVVASAADAIAVATEGDDPAVAHDALGAVQAQLEREANRLADHGREELATALRDLFSAMSKVRFGVADANPSQIDLGADEAQRILAESEIADTCGPIHISGAE